MKITVHTLASDTDMGTETRVYTTEDELNREFYELVILNSRYDDQVQPTFEEFCEDPWEFVDDFKSDPLDTYSTDQHVVDIPFWRIIRDSIQQHPALEGLARRRREALRLAGEFLRRVHGEPPARARQRDDHRE